MTRSWWLDLTEAQFALAVQREAARMANDPHAKKYQTDSLERKEPPRRSRPTVYTYHLEALFIEP